MKKAIKILVLTVLGIIVALIFLFIFASRQPVVKENYFEEVMTTNQALEQKYTLKGNYVVSTWEQDVGDEKIGSYKIWYPTKLEKSGNKYPLVVMANGTGVPASKYEAIFDHLASWGFIVIGNEDKSSWDGISSAKSLELMLELNNTDSSIFYRKIDIDNIGIAGHSQGGVGAINAVTAQENGNSYKTIYTASTPHLALAEGLKWQYDVSKINIPYFMTAGTLKIDAGDDKNSGIAPLFSLQENYQAISDDVTKIYARRVNTDHGDMLPLADGYMTAWFRYYLQDDKEAENVFFGDDAEILSNTNWQDVEINR
ncbi:chlorophyllase/cutinase-like alpha/beta fold protein [Lysinibacillus telephonicus]|uniref:poly(ethylene terephthalate) hydrolase family protein n=1 Tax=Lysinibacillus telephonicus TaxID=1714840 RepID=UPI0037CFFCA0